MNEPRFSVSTETAVTLEFIDEIGYSAFVFDELLKFKQKSGKKGFHYFTFKYDGWLNKTAYLIITEHPAGYLLVTAPELELDKAIEWVKAHNLHLHFHPTINFGYEGNDFIRSYKSANLNFTNEYNLVNAD